MFSNELVEFLSRRELSAGQLYRVDRHDIEPQFPVTGSLSEQMDYCKSHQLRLHSRDGTHPVDRYGRVKPQADDIVDGVVVTLGGGWHVREGDDRFGHYRWGGDKAELTVNRAAAPGLERGAILSLEFEPNAYQPASWIDIEILDRGRLLARRRVSRLHQNITRLNVLLDDNVALHEITLTVADSSDGRECLPLYERRERLLYRLHRAAVLTVPPLASLHEFDPRTWRRGEGAADLHFDPAISAVRLETDPGIYSYAAKLGPLQVPRDGRYEFALRYACSEGGISFATMDGNTGRWLSAETLEIEDVQRGQEHPLRIRTLSLLLNRGQKVWLFISNEHPDGRRPSRLVIEKLQGSVSLDEFRTKLDPPALRRSIAGRWTRVTRRARRLMARVRDFAQYRTRRLRGKTSGRSELPAAVPVTPAMETATELARVGDFLRAHRPAHIHQNACGDFQLVAREHWVELRGYPEFTMYSMNIDGLFGVIANYAGIREQLLEMPICIYHLEHEKGSGWTPEGEALLKQRIAASGITWLDASTVHTWGAYMAWLQRPMIFNGSDWGLGAESLLETVLPAAGDH